MPEFILTQLEYIGRIAGALFCGVLLGYERENHLKVAGVRTHAIVAMTSSMMMIISKYGFFDILTKSNISLDPSRIAAGIVSAIGFLGAGVILTRKVNVTGLTTAAGIWATVGIGMSFGAGMYIISIVATTILLVLQYLFHSKVRWFRSTVIEQITIEIDSSDDINAVLDDLSKKQNIEITNIRATRTSPETFELKLLVRFPEHYRAQDVFSLLRNNPKIKSIDS